MQLVQLDEVETSITVMDVPAMQFAHEVDPEYAAYVPSWQIAQLLAAEEAETLPAEQLTQLDAPAFD